MTKVNSFIKENVYLIVGKDFVNDSKETFEKHLESLEIQVAETVHENVNVNRVYLTESDSFADKFSIFDLSTLLVVAKVKVTLEERAEGKSRVTASVNIANHGTIFEEEIDNILDEPVFYYINENYDTEQSQRFETVYDFIRENFPMSEWEDLTLRDLESELALCEMTLYG